MRSTCFIRLAISVGTLFRILRHVMLETAHRTLSLSCQKLPTHPIFQTKLKTVVPQGYCFDTLFPWVICDSMTASKVFGQVLAWHISDRCVQISQSHSETSRVGEVQFIPQQSGRTISYSMQKCDEEILSRTATNFLLLSKVNITFSGHPDTFPCKIAWFSLEVKLLIVIRQNLIAKHRHRLKRREFIFATGSSNIHSKMAIISHMLLLAGTRIR